MLNSRDTQTDIIIIIKTADMSGKTLYSGRCNAAVKTSTLHPWIIGASQEHACERALADLNKYIEVSGISTQGYLFPQQFEHRSRHHSLGIISRRQTSTGGEKRGDGVGMGVGERGWRYLKGNGG